MWRESDLRRARVLCLLHAHQPRWHVARGKGLATAQQHHAVGSQLRGALEPRA